MDINNVTEIWASYDKHLAENLKVNKDILRQLHFGKWESDLSKLIKFEVFSALVYFALAGFILINSIALSAQPKYSLTGFAGVIVLSIYLVSAAIKIVSLSKMQQYYTPVVGLQKNFGLMSLRIVRLRKLEIWLIIPLALTIVPILFKTIYDIDVYQDQTWLILELVALIVIGFPAIYIFNKYWYDKKIDRARQILLKVSDFENNET